MTSNIKQVVLDALDGFGFQDTCAQILARLGYQVLENRKASDEGIDLLLKDASGALIAVECKHQLHTSIGRPVVQKLHSAILAKGIQKAMLITTGQFSSKAVNYARSLKNVQIDLIDINKLIQLASQAGIALILGGKELYNNIGVTGNGLIDLCQKFQDSLTKRILSYPRPSSEFIFLEISKLTLYPFYVVSYTLDQDFYTQAGLIHRVRASGWLILTPSGRFETLLRTRPPKTKALQDLKTELKSLGCSFQIPAFTKGLEHQSLLRHAKDLICSEYETFVSYVGRNNVRYQKKCTPTPSHVTVNKIELIYVPVWEGKVTIIDQQWNVKLLDVGATEAFENHWPLEGHWPKVVCNDCWKLVDNGNECSICHKTLCDSCTYRAYSSKARLEIPLCGECAFKEATSGRAVFPPPFIS